MPAIPPISDTPNSRLIYHDLDEESVLAQVLQEGDTAWMTIGGLIQESDQVWRTRLEDKGFVHLLTGLLCLFSCAGLS